MGGGPGGPGAGWVAQRRRGLGQDAGSWQGREVRGQWGAGGVCTSVCPCVSPRRHGQLGHGTLESELQPRLVEALAGVPMQAVAAGGWHSASISGEGLWRGSRQRKAPAGPVPHVGVTPCPGAARCTALCPAWSVLVSPEHPAAATDGGLGLSAAPGPP